MKQDKLTQEALNHYRSGRTIRAKNCFLALLKDNPDHEDANYYLGLIERSAGAFAEAAGYFNKALEVNPGEAAYWVAAIETLIDLGDRKAILVFRESLRRGLQGDTVERLGAKIKAKFSRIERSVQLANVRPLAGALYGQRQPVLLAEMNFRLPAGLEMAQARSILAGLLDVELVSPDFINATREMEVARLILGICLALQKKSGHPIFDPGKAEVTDASKSSYKLVIPYDHADTAGLVLKGAVAIVNRLLEEPNQPVSDTLKEQVKSLQEVLSKSVHQSGNMIGFLNAANQRKLPWLNMFGYCYQFGYGKNARFLDSTITDKTSLMGVTIAGNKTQTLKMLKQAGLPVPEHLPVTSVEEAIKSADSLGYPVVVKPVDRERGEGVRTGLKNTQEVKDAFEHAKIYSENIVVERHIPGIHYRLSVVGGKLLQAHYPSLAGVTGDGATTVRELMGLVNQDPRRGTSLQSPLVPLSLNQEALELLQEQGLTPDSIVEQGRFVRFQRYAQIRGGSIPISVTDKVHPDNKLLAERAASTLGLDIAGVDFIISDISKSWFTDGGAINEVNGRPRFRSVAMPEIYERVLEWLMAGSNGRIPIATIIGTGSRSVIARMLQSILLAKGMKTGVSCAQGAWVGEEAISYENWSGYRGGRLLLTNRQTEAAVIELTFSDIQAQGFPFDECDVAAFVNLGRESGNEMACEIQRVRKAIVAHADDEEILEQLVKAGQQKIILVARDGDNPRLQAHLSAGRVGAWLEKMDGNYHLLLGTMGNSAILCNTHEVNYSNDFSEAQALDLLFASALAYALDCNAETIHQGLGQFCRQGGK